MTREVKELFSQVYKALELGQRESCENVRAQSSTREVQILSLSSYSSKCNIVAVDAGLGRIQVGNTLLDVVQVVAIGTKISTGKFFIRSARSSEDINELIGYVRTCELRTALTLNISRYIVLLDGALEKCAQDPRVLASLSLLVEKDNVVVALSKQHPPKAVLSRESSDKISLKVLDRFGLGRVRGLRVVVSSGAIQGTPMEIYVRRDDSDTIMHVVATVFKLCLNSVAPGYPLPLAIADYMSRLGARELTSIRSIVERLGSATLEISLHVRPLRIV